MFSAQLLEHFYRPQWVGNLERPSASATEGHAPCGDVVRIDIRVEDGLVAEARFRTLGCAVAIAASDALCQIVGGQTLSAAQFLHLDELVAALGGIPPLREGCASAPLSALRSALRLVVPPVR